MKKFVPLLIGICISLILHVTTGWWAFLVIFPWIGFSISLGVYLQRQLPKPRKRIARKISMLMILPCLLLFVPLVNRENFQLEGIVLLISIGFFSKGVIHLAIAKIFGPLIWRRGFCGWACWTAAVLEWLPVGIDGGSEKKVKDFRLIMLLITVTVPLYAIVVMSYDIRKDYLYKSELYWMFISNAIYYLLAIPLAFINRDQRAFCKILCPVSLIMKVPSRLSLIKIKPSGKKCVECGVCNKNCPMGIDVMSHMKKGEKIRDTECILCSECRLACPVGAIK